MTKFSRSILSVSITTLLAAASASAANLTWDVTPGGTTTTGTPITGDGLITGGTGAWDNTTGNWTTDGGATDLNWDNTLNAADTAVFQGTGGTVTLANPINLGGIVFSSTGYTLTGQSLAFGSLLGSIDSSALGTGSNSGTIASAITGTAGLTIDANGNLTASGGASSGALTISGTNTGLTGGIAITGGLVNFTTSSAAGSTATTAGSGDTLTLSNGGGLITSAGVTLGNNIVLSTGGGTFRAYSGKTMTLNGVLSGSGGFNKTDSGTLLLANNSSTFTGAVNVEAGTMQLGNSASNSTFAFTGSSLTVASGATLAFGSASGGTITVIYNFNNLAAPVSVSGGTVSFIQTNNTTQTFNAPLAFSGTSNLAFSASAYSGHAYNLNGNITGTGTLNLSTSGSGTARNIVIAGASNAYTGNVVLGTAAASSTLTLTTDMGGASWNINNANWTVSLPTAATTYTFADLNGAVASTITGAGTLQVGSGNGNDTYAGILASTLSLVKQGTGSLTLSGASTYTGGTTITDGTLQLGNGGTTGSIVGNVTNNGTLAFNRSGTVTFGGAISGTGAVNQIGTGTTILTGATTYTGGTTITAGTLVFSPGASMTGAMTVGAGGSLVAGHLSGTTTDIVGNLSSSGTINIAGAGTAGTLTGGGDIVLNGGTVDFDLAALTSGIGDLVNSVNLTLGGTTMIAVNKLGSSLQSGTYTLFNYSGTLTGDASNLALSGLTTGTSRQTFTLGTTGQTNGSVTLTVVGSAGNLTWKGDGLANVWDLITTSNFLNGGVADKYYDGDNVVFDDSGSNSPAITLVGSLLPNSVTVSNTAQAYTFGGSGSIDGSTGLTKNGTGTLTIQNTNSFTGPVAINNGTVSVAMIANGGTSSALGAGTSITLGDATNTGDLQYTGVSASTNRILSLNAGGGIVEVTPAATTLTETGVVSGSGALTKAGNGALVLAGTNTYSGKTIVNGGTLQVGIGTTAGSLGTGSVNVGALGTLAFYRADNGLTIANSLAGSGALNFNGTGTSAQSSYILTGDNSAFSGTITATNARVQASNATASEFGTGILVTGTNGEFFLTGGTFANNFMISGTGWLESAGQLGALRVTGATISGTVTMTGASTISAYGGSGTISGSIGETGGSQSLTLGVGAQAGTITLSGASTYTGATSIAKLTTVNLTGSLGATAVTVADGAILGGHGTIGNGGSLTLGTVTGATLSVDPTTSGALSVGGNVTLNGTNVVSLASGVYLPVGAPYTLMTYTGSLTGSAANLSLANASSYRQAVFSTTGGQITLDIGAKALTWTGALGGNWDVATTQSWNDTTFSQQAFYAGDAVTFDDTANSTNTAVTLVGTLQPQSVTFNNSSNNYVFSGTGAIGGSTSLTMNGPGSVTLGQTETFTGGVVVNNGTLVLGGPNGTVGTLGNSSGITINGGQVLVKSDNALEGTGGAKPVTIYTGGELNISSGATTHIVGLLTLKGGTLAGPAATGNGASYGEYDLDNAVVAGGVADTSEISAASVALTHAGGTTVTVNPGATSGIDLDVSGSFSHTTGSTDTGLIKAGNGVMQLSGTNNNYTGPTTVNAGTLIVSGSVPASPVTVNGGTFSVSSTGTVGGPVTVSSGTAVVSGSLSGTTVAVNGGSLQIASGGTVSSATVTLNSGSIVANGTITNAPAVNGGTLSGAGTINGLVTVNTGGTLAPGQSGTGVLLLNNGLTLNSGSHLALTLGGTSFGAEYPAMGIGGGTVTLGGDLQLTLAYTPAIGDIFYLVINQAGSAINGAFSNAVDQGNGTGLITTGGVQFLVSYTASYSSATFVAADGQDIALRVMAVVPEPGVAASLLGGFGLLLGLRRRPTRVS